MVSGSITVIGAQDGAEERQQRRADTTAQIEIQERVARYTKGLFIVGAVDVFALAIGLYYSIQATRASVRAANAAWLSAVNDGPSKPHRIVPNLEIVQVPGYNEDYEIDEQGNRKS